jgi:hypothetical protein
MGEAAKVWTEALENVLRVCLPHELRVQMLAALLERDRDRDAKPFRIISVGELMAMKFADYRAKKEAYALMIQIMTRSITSDHAPETAAALLFRDQHGYGTGSGWLPDYLDGLPGITVDLKECAAIADAARPSCLCEAMAAT